MVNPVVIFVLAVPLIKWAKLPKFCAAFHVIAVLITGVPLNVGVVNVPPVTVLPVKVRAVGRLRVTAPVDAEAVISAAVPARVVTGVAGIPWVWSLRALKATEPVAAESPKAWVTGTVASNAAMVASERSRVAATPAAAAVLNTTDGVAKASRP